MAGIHQVAIVLDREFGEQLRELAEQMHVWVCGSPANRKSAEEIWAKSPQHSLDHGVTTFNEAGYSALADYFESVLGDVDLHHGEYSHDPAWSMLHIYGIPDSPRVREILATYGVDNVVLFADHFTASRPATASAR